MIQPLHREAVQIDEVAGNIQPDQLPLTLPVVAVAKHGPFDDIIGMLDPLSTLDQSLPRFEPDSATDRFFEPGLFLCSQFVPQAALQKKFGVQCSFQIRR